MPQDKRTLYADASKRPLMLPLKPEGIAEELRDAVRFMLWVLVLVKGKWSKVPRQANGRNADSTNPKTWASFAKIHAAYAKGGTDGVGFALGDGFAGIDLDNCRNPDTEEISPWAKRIIYYGGTYAEVSPSGTGVKLIGRGTWEGGWHKKPTHDGGEIEIYDCDRYFAITGHRVNEHGIGDIDHLLAFLAIEYGDTPRPPRNAPPPNGQATSAVGYDAEILLLAMTARNGAKFSRLWMGDPSDCGGDDSRADLALCGMLAFYCGPDTERIDGLFRQSGLMRDKWDSKRGDSTYGRDTLTMALVGKTEFYLWGRTKSSGVHGTSPAGNTPPAPTANMLSYRQFPVDTLPPVLREFAERVALSVGCDVAFAALPALTLAGAAIGAAIVATPKRGWKEPPAIWACIVADSGTGKSPAMKDCSSQAFEIDRELREVFDTALTKYKEDFDSYSVSMKAFDPSSGTEKPEKPRKPKREYFTVVDTTIERLAEMLGDSHRGLLVVRDELAGWFSSFSRYKSQAGGSDVPNWLSLFDCGAIRVHRRTGEPRDIETDRAFAAVFGGIQPDILSRHLTEPGYVESGLAARIIFAAPPKFCPCWSSVELDSETERRFGQVLRHLRAIPFDQRKPTELGLDFSALERFIGLNNEFAERAGNVDGGPMSAVLPKAVRYALRFALIHHCVTEAAQGRDAARGCITETSMLAGETLSRWFVHEAERVYAAIGEKPEERATRCIDGLVKRLAIREGGTVRPRDLQRANKSKFPTAEIAEAALDALASSGHGTWREVPMGKSGGRPSREFLPETSVEPDSRQNPTQRRTTASDEEESHPDTTRDTLSPDTSDSADADVVSGSVGCRVRVSTLKEASGGEVGKPQVLSDATGGKPKKRSKGKPDSLYGEPPRGLPD